MSSNPRRLLPPPPGSKEVIVQPDSFASRLREFMQLRGMSQSDLARAMWGSYRDSRGFDVARNRDRISQYCRGLSTPEPQNLKKLAEVLRVDIKDLAPDLVAEAISGDDSPTVAMQAVAGRPDMVHLRVNTLVSLATAAEVVSLISRDPDRGRDN